MAKLIIDAKTCTGCEACVPTCPFGALSMKDKVAVVDEKCTFCGACVDVCPVSAITLEKDEKAVTIDTSAYKDVWVFVEHERGKVSSVSFELLGQGRTLADALGCKLCGMLLCSSEGIDGFIKEAIAYGAEKVYVTESPLLKEYRTDPYASGAVNLIRKYQPEVVLFGATTQGRDFAGTVATTLETGLTADCTGLDIDPEKKILRQTRPAFGGNIMATILDYPNYRPQMATVRPKVFLMPAKDESRKGDVIKESLPITEEQIRTKVLEFIKGTEAVNLVDAEIIVSGGRGVGNAENFQDHPRSGQCPGRRCRSLPCHRRCRVDFLRAPGGADGPDGQTQNLFCLRYLGCHSASGGNEDLGHHCCHQQRSGGADL